MRPGRPRKPTSLKVIEGNPGKRPLPVNEPKPAPLEPKCPEWLTAEAKRIWYEMMPQLRNLGLMTVVDGYSFAAACENFAEWIRCQKYLRAKDPATKKPRGKTFTTPNGYIQQRPEVAMGHKALAEARAWFTEFGLTPASRTRIDIKPIGNEEDPMEQQFKRAGV